MSAYDNDLAVVKKTSSDALRAELIQHGFDTDDVYNLAQEQLTDEGMA